MRSNDDNAAADLFHPQQHSDRMQVIDDFANLTKSRSRPKVDPPHHSSSSSSMPVGRDEIEKQRRGDFGFSSWPPS